MIDGLGSNGFASISSELLEVLEDSRDVGKYWKVSVVTEGVKDSIGDVELMIVDGLPVDVENLLINIVWWTQAEVVLSAE